MKKEFLILILGLVLISGCNENIPITGNDFDVESLEYVSFDTKTNIGVLKLVVDTKIDNLFINVSSGTDSYCSNKCGNIGECVITDCIGDLGTQFIVKNANKDHTFRVCVYTNDRTYGACKDVLLKVYSSGLDECSLDSDCNIGGCSGQVCTTKEKARDMVTTCEYSPLYDCYRLTSCGCVSGKCSWKENDKFNDCIKKFREGV